nr:TetR/AcrR family transcriptional regulator C-terminal domain-containing protein [Acetobacter senegalensis]
MPTGDPRAGLTKIGLDYARRMRQPDMRAMFRLIVAEAPRFPDLGQMLFQRGFGPFWNRLIDYLAAEKSAGTLILDDPGNVARAFLATIAGQVLWPELVVAGCGGSDDAARQVVTEAIETTLARYAVRRGQTHAAMTAA